MRGLRVVCALAIVVGGLLLAVSPFLIWVGVQAFDFSRTYTLSEALKGLEEQDLLGPGMSVVPLVLAGSLAVISGVLEMTTGSRAWPLVAIVIGAAAGAYAAYLHAALEFSNYAAMVRVQTTPGAGLFLAIGGSIAVLAGGMVSVAGLRPE